jgi:hypothetical protein
MQPAKTFEELYTFQEARRMAVGIWKIANPAIFCGQSLDGSNSSSGIIHRFEHRGGVRARLAGGFGRFLKIAKLTQYLSECEERKKTLA